VFFNQRLFEFLSGTLRSGRRRNIPRDAIANRVEKGVLRLRAVRCFVLPNSNDAKEILMTFGMPFPDIEASAVSTFKPATRRFVKVCISRAI
jgi:hypothetical protein